MVPLIMFNRPYSILVLQAPDFGLELEEFMLFQRLNSFSLIQIGENQCPISVTLANSEMLGKIVPRTYVNQGNR